MRTTIYYDIYASHDVLIKSACAWPEDVILIQPMHAGPWLAEHVDLRDQLNGVRMDIASTRKVTLELQRRIMASGRTWPEPRLSERALLRMEAEERKQEAVAEQRRLDAASEGLQVSFSSWPSFLFLRSKSSKLPLLNDKLLLQAAAAALSINGNKSQREAGGPTPAVPSQRAMLRSVERLVEPLRT